MFKHRFAFAAGLLVLFASAELHAQARKWVIPPYVVDFSTSPPATQLLPGAMQPTDPFQDRYIAANGAFDSTGKLLFYVRQGQNAPKLDVFDGNGKKIAQLAGASDSLQISIVPVPASCDQKYYIFYFTRPTIVTPRFSLYLTYAIFDVQLGAITSRNVQIAGRTYLPFGPFGTSVVSPPRGDATRYLYVVNSDVVDKFLINSAGISFVSPHLSTSASGYRPVQAALSSDGGRLAVGTAKGILLLSLDTQGDLSGSSEVMIDSPVSGLAFSRDGSMLFFGDDNGIEYFRLDDPSTVMLVPDSVANSQLELAVDDKIYAGGLNDDPVLSAVNPLGPTPSFQPTAVPGVIAGNLTGVLSLPAQIAGEPLCGNPALIQSTFYTKGNFEVLTPYACGGLIHYWSNNDLVSPSWSSTVPFGQELGAVDAVSMIQRRSGDLEAVARIGDRLAYFQRSNNTWSAANFFATGVSGTPSLVQGTYGVFPPGNFELVAPLAAGGIGHYWRDNQLNWYGDFIASSATLPGPVADVSLIQSTLGVLGNDLQMIARVGDQLFEFSRNNMGIWSEPTLVAGGVSGTPSLIQSNFGDPGNLELVTPLAKGGMAHYWRGPTGIWTGPNRFADGSIRSVSLIQSNYGQDFEVVARHNCSLVHYSRTGAAPPNPWFWSGATTIVP